MPSIKDAFCETTKNQILFVADKHAMFDREEFKRIADYLIAGMTDKPVTWAVVMGCFSYAIAKQDIKGDKWPEA